MDMLRERTELQKTEFEKAQKHNELINENFLKIKNLVHAQFDEDEVQDVAETVEEVVEETPLYISPASVTNLEQAPIVTEYSSPMATAVFTAQKYEIAKENTQPVEYTAPVQATQRAVEVSYALTPLAKVIMAAFTFVVVAMLALICMNTQIIRQKSIRIQNLEEKKQQLLNQVDEIESRIAAAQSEETILQYALENGIVLGN
jgi:outer membrane murein-binding lipoprotein Lpp